MSRVSVNVDGTMVLTFVAVGAIAYIYLKNKALIEPVVDTVDAVFSWDAKNDKMRTQEEQNIYDFAVSAGKTHEEALQHVEWHRLGWTGQVKKVFGRIWNWDWQ